MDNNKDKKSEGINQEVHIFQMRVLKQENHEGWEGNLFKNDAN